MRAFAVALLIAVAVFCCSAALAQTPKFTIVSVTSDPPGPLAPGSRFKIKVIVRNDGDTIPAGRRFDFVFTTPSPLAIAPPTGTPALFFGYCPGATPVNMVCQCFAAWEKGQTVELETEVTVGSTARGTSTVTFRVSSGTVAETASVTVQIVLAGPDLTPDVTDDFKQTKIRGRLHFLDPIVMNSGTTPSQGQFRLTASLSGGLYFGEVGNAYTSATLIGNSVIAPGARYFFGWRGGGRGVALGELGLQSIILTITGGGDVEPSNNSRTFQFEVIREDPDPLNRLYSNSELAEILGR